MTPRECDNDDCDDEDGKWVHAEGCEPTFPLSGEEMRAAVLARRPRRGSFLEYMLAAMAMPVTKRDEDKK